MASKTLVVVPWHNRDQVDAFCHSWGIHFGDDDRVVFQQDTAAKGCAVTKNMGVAAAVRMGAEIVIVLDDDCFSGGLDLQTFIDGHVRNLSQPAPVDMFLPVTTPQSRGTPYHARHIEMPVAASMGFWTHVGDYDAPGQLVHGATTPMGFDRRPIHGRYFPLCGMNLAFRPADWLPWCMFIDVPRFDDIWAGWLWQKEAYRRGYCFRLDGPLVKHGRQSNVWKNLADEVKYLERNETLWRDIALSQETDYDALRRILPV